MTGIGKTGWILGMGAAVVLVSAGCQATRAGYESAPFQTLRKDGRFSLRQYPALAVVETPMPNGKPSSENGFSKLFNYITGKNGSQQKIAMTTPVFMSGSVSNSTMAFVLPAKLSAKDAPKPSDPDVQLREIEGGSFAVYRFKGGRNPKTEATALETLRQWLASQAIAASEDPAIYGYFDPPWTPVPFRRNEVMLRLRPGTVIEVPKDSQQSK